MHIAAHTLKVCSRCSVMSVEKAGGREGRGTRQTAERRDGERMWYICYLHTGIMNRIDTVIAPHPKARL